MERRGGCSLLTANSVSLPNLQYEASGSFEPDRFPAGPTIIGNRGDTFIVNVKNSLQDNGTGLHWHGIRELNSNQHDGTVGITECPVTPGQTRQYRFRCLQFGTGCYHAHLSAQTAEGLTGGIICNGPADTNYDTDVGTLAITDWYYETGFVNNWRALHTTTGPPVPETGLINGTMKNAQGGGAYHVTNVQKGQRYRIRLVNMGVDNHFHVTIDNHAFTVIASDFVPIQPFVTNSLSMAVGQRYDVIIVANQTVGNYWLRVQTGDCNQNANQGNIRSIIRYQGAPQSDPNSQGVTQPTGCFDEKVTPFVSNQVPQDQFRINPISLDFNPMVTALSSGLTVNTWLVNGSDMIIDWRQPSLKYILDGNTSHPPDYNIYVEPQQEGQWTFWVIQTVANDQVNTAHPIHLHSHDFYVLGSGTGQWDQTTNGLIFNNPPRRDTAVLPAGGYLILGWPIDNPGKFAKP
jgi:FtsP/CotA-like multicopper oxidase with cupredoxin domain